MPHDIRKADQPSNVLPTLSKECEILYDKYYQGHEIKYS
jgi:hypothetical protein